MSENERDPRSETDWSALPLATQEQRSDAWETLLRPGDLFKTAENLWLFVSAKAVRFAHSNPDIFSSNIAMTIGDLPVPLIPIAIDPPEHRKYRLALDDIFSAEAIAAIEPALVGRARSLVESFAGDGECEAMRQYCIPFPMLAFLSFFGLPIDDHEEVRSWVEVLIEKDPYLRPECGDEYYEASWALYRYLHGNFANPNSISRGDVLGKIAGFQNTADWSIDDSIGLAIVLLMAGLDTVTSAMGHLLLRLAQDKTMQNLVRQSPKLQSTVIEEVLRLEPPAPFFPRVVTKDVTVCGVEIPEGARVMLCVASANRDPSRFPDPTRIDALGARRSHFSFGGGVHRCLGIHLGRTELRIALEEFNAGVSDYSIDPRFPLPTAVWPSGTLHLESLPLSFSSQ